MNGAETLISARNVTIEDDPEPGDPPPRPPSPPSRKLSPSPAQQTSSHQISPSPQVIDLDTPASDEPEFMSQLAYTNALIRQATMPILPHDLEDFGIPPSPPGTPDPTLSQKLQNFRQLRDRGVYFNDRLGGNRGFRNPKLLEKLRGYAGIEDEYGSHLPLSTWNPHGFQEDQYYDRLAEKQRQEFEALQARQQNEPRSSIEFTSTSSHPAASAGQKSAAERIMEGLNSRPNSRPVSRTGSDGDRKRHRHDDRRDDRRDDRGHYRGGDRRDDKRNGGRSRDRSRERERGRGRGGYRDRDDRGRSSHNYP